MADFTWLEAEEDLSPTALTVRAQAMDPLDMGQLLWSGFMPRRDVDTTKLQSLTSLDVRVTADRREWNTRGRYIPLETPERRELEWVPIEAYFKVEEKEMQDLLNEVRGNQALFRDVISARIPARTEMLAMAVWRRLELDVFSAWANGSITTANPATGATVTTSFGFDAGRYQTAGTAWNDAGTNAYDDFLAWMEDAIDTVGPIEGAMMRIATRNAIQADAPNPMPGAQAGLKPTVPVLEQRISDELGMPFRFYINEQTVDTFDDGGTAYTRSKVWPAQKVAAVPSGLTVGTTAFAPVARAYDISSQDPTASVDVRGVTVYHDIANGGRELTVEAQINPMPDPDEQKMYVIDAGV
jgi:hypothetical protein